MKILGNYYFFWKDKLGQWTRRPFTDNYGITYNCAEQYMMAQKALFFNDVETFFEIMMELDPAKQQKLGRKVKNFDNEKWNNVREMIVVQASLYKYTQNDEMYETLMGTKKLILVEASKSDKIWGIGRNEKYPYITDESTWLGLNLLGKSIMLARDYIYELGREEAKNKVVWNDKEQGEKIMNIKTATKWNFEIFDTDYYQLYMIYAMIMLGKANQITGYEGFVRNVKEETNPNKDYYIFSGTKEVTEYMERISKEVKNPNLVEGLIERLDGIAIIKNPNWKEELRERFKTLITDFEYSIVEEGTKVLPFIPVYQIKTPFWIGQTIETNLTNIYNGKTGAKTLLENVKNGNITDISIEDAQEVVDLANDLKETSKQKIFYDNYINKLKDKAKEFREVEDSAILLEAGYRRSLNKTIAKEASRIALEAGWDGTSNTMMFYYQGKEKINYASKIGGTTAHAFIMSFKTELEAFKACFEIYDNVVVPVDTYGDIKGVQTLIDNNLEPKDVRLDSGDFFKLPFESRKKLDAHGWTKTGNYLSGDVSIELIKELKARNVPYNKTMVGTKYVYCDELIARANSGFVYKVVQYEDIETKEMEYPIKKASGRSNYAGLKTIEKIGDNEFNIIANSNPKKLDLSLVKEINETSTINFIEK